MAAATATKKPQIQAFFDEPTNTVSYLVWDGDTYEGAVIDPVLDYDFRTGDCSAASADKILARAQELGVTIGQVLETHAHADHLSGAPYIKLKTGAKVAIEMSRSLSRSEASNQEKFNEEPASSRRRTTEGR